MNRKKWVVGGVLVVVVVALLLMNGCNQQTAEAPADNGPSRSADIGSAITRFKNVIIENGLFVSGGSEFEMQMELAVPTAQGTATPALVIENDSVANSLEIRNAGSTPVFYVDVDGNVTYTGMTSGGGLIAAAVGVAAPTAVGTATPAFYADSLGVSNLFEVRDAATPVAYWANGGVFTQVGNASVGGTLAVTGASTFTGVITAAVDQENLGIQSVISTTVAFGSASGTIATIGANELWIVHAVYGNVTADFDCDTTDCAVIIGDGGDTDGLLVLADAELQAADTEMTGAVAGWQGFGSTDVVGAYLAEGLGFIYNPGSEETIDWAVAGTNPAAGSLDVYVVYTRVY